MNTMIRIIRLLIIIIIIVITESKNTAKTKPHHAKLHMSPPDPSGD